MQSIIESALDLLFAFVDFLKVSIVSVPALQFIGIILVVFLLGVLFGRMTKRGIQQTVEQIDRQNPDRISLDFERLTPLGPSDEEAAKSQAMDITDFRTDRMPQAPAIIDSKKQKEPTLLKE